MKKSDISATIAEFQKEHGDIQPLEPQLIGFSQAIGKIGDIVEP